ncbi:hypothetical protein QMG83_02380 [Salinibacterium sp. G-O1]|uniref:hypothetical protein n=1 Tax=Salinibacterium sp. G-O1 TaxID=3046208 RepID=UPI0024BB7083|nr:hypothetical protein [Salinibacterium sp. G-O1]MDJ0334063.1 hypothetical protein [Salinibacterium sp. G-O1]
MPQQSAPRGSGPRLTLLGALTVSGDVIILSLGWLVLTLGLVTAGPASAAAIDARAAIGLEGPSRPIRTLLSGTAKHFSTLWSIGPIALLIGLFAWIGTAFWLSVPPPAGVAMLAVVLCVTAVLTLVILAIPSAASPGQTLRATVIRAARLVAARPFFSVLALATIGAGVLVATYIPTIGIVAIGALLVETTWRAWGATARVRD